MRSKKTKFNRVALSLEDAAGAEYVDAVAEARAGLMGNDAREYLRIARTRIDFFPPAFQAQILDLLPRIGTRLTAGLKASARGASTRAFLLISRTEEAPLSGRGPFRVAEIGTLYFIAKSEHYHAPLGHGFPGYELVNRARALGIPNATNNNTRGHITRLLEEELVRTAARIGRDERIRLDRRLASGRAGMLNRVLNLETGSLAAEAALKMLLARFYRHQADSPKPKYEGRVPVVVVMGDYAGGVRANYHGTTVLAQVMRGLWGALREGLDSHNEFVVRGVRPNHRVELEWVFDEFEKTPYKIAGFVHEFVLMNYGAVRLDERFVKTAYALCKKHDVPVVADEIQTGVWSPRTFMFHEYGVRPTIVTVGKGFPGGEYPASRILFGAELDTLPQFGSLVTNGQEELSSLAYLITMRWTEANADVTAAVGNYYEERLRELSIRHAQIIRAVEGRRHLAGIHFHRSKAAKTFAASCTAAGLDISVSPPKPGCPPAVLTKLPLIAGYEAVDAVLDRMEQAVRTC